MSLELKRFDEKAIENLCEKIEKRLFAGEHKMLIVNELTLHNWDEYEAFEFVNEIDKTIKNSPEKSKILSTNEFFNSTKNQCCPE